jgi:anti-sigma factor RsiW
MMSNCITKENLVLYMDKELAENEIKSIEKHLQNCNACRKELENFRKIDSAISSIKSIEPSEEFDAGFWKAMDSIQKPEFQCSTKGKKAHWKSYLSAGMAATIILAAGISLFSTNFGQNREISLIENLDMLHDYELATNLELLENWDVIIQMEDQS